jgi:putative transposase
MIIDTFSRFSPGIEPRFNFRGADVVEVLERVGREVGLPAVIRVDQGSEFVDAAPQLRDGARSCTPRPPDAFPEEHWRRIRAGIPPIRIEACPRPNRPGGNRILVPYGRAGKFARCETPLIALVRSTLAFWFQTS